MRDRLSTKILSNGATRYGVYDETGNLLRYEYIKLEDEPTVEGDLFSKANMLPDSIPAALGLKMANPQVKDALNVLAHVGNLHVWKRKYLVAEAGYTLGDLETVNITHGAGSNYSSENFSSWVYSDEISVDESGVVSLVNPTQTNDLYYDAYSRANVLAGKYAQINPNISPTNSLAKLGSVYFFPAGNSASRNTDDGSYNITLPGKIVSGYPSVFAKDFLTSTDQNAYPDNVTDAQDAYYTLGDVVSGTIVPVTTSQVQFKYSTTVTVYDNGDLNVDGDVVNLQNYNTEGTSTIKGKYIVPVTTGASISGVWFIPSDATFSLISEDGDPTKRYLYCDKMQPVTGHAAIPANTTITYLGQLGDGARIEVGSYVGTGTYGSSNPNTLTFGVEPKLLIIRNAGSSKEYLFLSAVKSGRYVSFSLSGSGSSVGSYTGVITLSGNIVSWYADNSQAQMNLSDNTFHYIALG